MRRNPIGGGGKKEETRGSREERRAQSADGGGEEEEEEERRTRGARTETRRARTEGGRAERGQRRRRRRRRKEERAEREEERRDHHCAGEKAVGAASERREARKESSGSHPRREDKPEGQREEPDGRRAADATWRRRSPIQGRRWRRPSKEQHKAVPRAVPKVHGAEASTERTERNDRSGVGTEMPVRMLRTSWREAARGACFQGMTPLHTDAGAGAQLQDERNVAHGASGGRERPELAADEDERRAGEECSHPRSAAILHTVRMLGATGPGRGRGLAASRGIHCRDHAGPPNATRQREEKRKRRTRSDAAVPRASTWSGEE